MSEWKSFFASRTVWANGIGLAALIGSAFGIDLPQEDQQGATDAVLQIVAGLSFLVSTAFRVMAKRRLTL